MLTMEKELIFAAKLLPKENWSKCSRCGIDIPEFEFSQQFQSRISDLISQGHRVETTMELRQVSGCDLKTAKVWVTHKTYNTPFQEHSTCPYCGRSLRTPRAKQCRHCKRDWH